MKASSTVALGLIIVSVGAVVWWQIIAPAPAGQTVVAVPPEVVPETSQEVPDSVPPVPDTNDTPADPLPQPEPAPTEPAEQVMCTQDAKLCPDGSYVGRTGPQCEFAACPATEPSSTITCTPEMRNRACTKEYAPVCGLRQVQCVTTPCDPIPETFGNGCSACSDAMVVSYTAGACVQ